VGESHCAFVEQQACERSASRTLAIRSVGKSLAMCGSGDQPTPVTMRVFFFAVEGTWRLRSRLTITGLTSSLGKVKKVSALAQDYELMEFICNEGERDLQHMAK
jgi:hypothetical protein